MVAAGSGCRVMAVAVPMRYIHSPLAVMDTADLQPTADSKKRWSPMRCEAFRLGPAGSASGIGSTQEEERR